MESQIHFESSKAGELTCCFQGKYLHSKYNPESEGERFAESITADFSPLCVFILEPALSYCAQHIKARFQSAECYAIRFCRFFADSDSLWDGVFYLDSNIPLSEQLFTTISEEKLISSLALDWAASKQIFPAENLRAWNEIKTAILKARDVLGTRSYFSKRWLKNSLIFASKLQNPVTAEKGNSAIVVAASGPSLASSLPFLKKFRDSFFLIAVSSAFMPLSKHGIAPDMVMSSDGGYWAKKHLDFPKQKETVFALEAECAVSKEILARKNILPLCYADGLERNFLEAIGCPYQLSERNGTIAGTALCFAHELTSGKVYLCGFDQAPAHAFQHTQPNALESDNAKKDFRLKNTETRITAARFSSAQSLAIYRDWFISNSAYFSKRVFRLSDNFQYAYSLGSIKENNWEDFKEKEGGKNKKKPRFIRGNIRVAQKERSEKLLKMLDSLSESEKFLAEVFPLDSLLIQRELSEEKQVEKQAQIRQKARDFVKSCEKFLNRGQ